MRIVITGASGLIGTALAARLTARGDTVIQLVRRPVASEHEIEWAPELGRLEPGALRGADAVVNLAGASISRIPWTRATRREIRESRLQATGTIVAALTALAAEHEPLPALVSGSASGFYGDRPGQVLTEDSPAGIGFLAEVVSEWEAMALTAPAGVRVALARTGLVIAPRGGALAPLRLMTRVGLAGPISGGRQHWAWIALEDEVSALIHLIDSDISGPVNLVGPTPASAADTLRSLATRSRRPYWLPLPLAQLMGQAGRELLAADQQVSPDVLNASGFVFSAPTVDAAIAAALRG